MLYHGFMRIIDLTQKSHLIIKVCDIHVSFVCPLLGMVTIRQDEDSKLLMDSVVIFYLQNHVFPPHIVARLF